MQLGMIGLGKVGANMSQRLIQAGHEVIGFDLKASHIGSSLRCAISSGAIASRRLPTTDECR